MTNINIYSVKRYVYVNREFVRNEPTRPHNFEHLNTSGCIIITMCVYSYRSFCILSTLRFGSKTDEQNGEDRKGHRQRNQKTHRNGTNPRKQPQRKLRRAKAMWIQTADI